MRGVILEEIELQAEREKILEGLKGLSPSGNLIKN